MKTIKTTHQATKKSEPETTFWFPSIDAYFSPSQHERDVKNIPRHLREFLDKLMGLSLQEVKWVPVTVEDVPEQHDRTIYRGYRTYPEGVLIDPIIIRGKEQEEVEGTVRQWMTSNGKEKSVWWKGRLSDGERKKFAELFDETLLLETTPVLIYDLRVRVKNRAIKDTVKFLQEKSKEAQEALTEVLRDKALQGQ